jgi:hypothetical protein
MNSYINYSTPTSFRSKFNPIVGLHPDFISSFNKDFLHPLFLKLSATLGIHQGEFEFLNIEELITEKEFKDIRNLELAKPYFYEILFERIYKNEKGRIRNRIKFTFTYDIDLTPIQKGEIRYGLISLGNKPVFYYCYVDLQKVIDFLKQIE